MSALEILEVGPGVTVQDSGRPGYLGEGVSRGGAADRLALAEGAALLKQPVGAALEMAGLGGRFRFGRAARIALTGAPMRATLDGVVLRWNASHTVPDGAVLEIGGVTQGVYGYLTVGGGIDLPLILGAMSAHLAAGISGPLQAGDRIALKDDAGGVSGLGLAVSDRFEGGTLRVLPSLQTDVFPKHMRDRFETDHFTRDTRGNRMGVRLKPSSEGYGLEAGGRILSEVITPGDIQIPGDGAPYILLGECQTTGGYPRIGTVIPADLPRVAQAAPGANLRFRFVSREEALAAEGAYRTGLDRLRAQVAPLVRDPHDINLLAYDLVSGVTDGEVMR
ncbi:urea amidolyase [Sagittula sp. NFXS13]|uniref:5-oxoprolinase subunit C family protein n=1 Tax=Sagittula sp. NFXS13 TaxID=2819095 RepID=UPI0032E03EE4